MALIRMNAGRSLTPRFAESLIEELPDRVRRMLEGTLEPVQAVGWVPPMEILDKKDALVIIAELPGVKIDDVNLSLEDDVITITGEKREEKKEGESDSEYYLWERRFGSFHRAFTLPYAVDQDTISAAFDNGVLTVTLPKAAKAKAKGRKIPITTKS